MGAGLGNSEGTILQEGGINAPYTSSKVGNYPQLSYLSFFNQQNIIGDPVVKPFSISTPNNVNQNFIAAADYSDGKSSQSKDASATKGIGAHLLQI